MTAPVSLERRMVAADLKRQLAHWLATAKTFRNAEEFAAIEAWRAVERDIGLPLRKEMHRIVEGLIAEGETVESHICEIGSNVQALARATTAVQRFRRHYIQVDTTLDYLGDAINSRTSPVLRTALSTLDTLAVASMESVLKLSGKPVPRVLVYLDKGTGASILRAGVRLWTPGAVMPVAAIKIVRHNLYRPTSLFHEVGHQVAHLTGWTEATRAALASALVGDKDLQAMWTPWASEIAADTFAFLHTGFASVAALYDVVSDRATIMRWPPGDPHPIGWLRTMLGCEMARLCFGAQGPWYALQRAMVARFPAQLADGAVQPLLERSARAMSAIAHACIEAPVPALGGKPMTSVYSPSRVSPEALTDLERQGGASLWTSEHWRRAEGIRIVALAGLREAERPEQASHWIERARGWLNAEAKAA